MSSQFENHALELFPINQDQIKDISHTLELQKYSAYIPREAGALFRDDVDCLWHLVQLLRANNTVATVAEEDNRQYLMIVGKCSFASLTPYFIKNKDYAISLYNEGPAALDISRESEFRTFRRIIQSQLSIDVKPPLFSNKWDIIDKSNEIINPPPGDDPASVFLRHCHVYRGVVVRFRKYGNDYFLQVIPQAKIELDTELDKLLRDGVFKKDTLLQLVSHVRLPTGNSVRLLGFLDSDASDVVQESTIFDQRSFFEFASDNYPYLKLKNCNSSMVAVASETGPAMLSLEALTASLTFTTLDTLNEKYFSTLISLLKFESAKRLDRAVSWISQISPIKLNKTELQISSHPREIMVFKKEIETDLSNIDIHVPGAIFKNPPVSFKVQSKNLAETEIPYGYFKDLQGSVNDLMTNAELKPLDAPEKISTIAFVQTSLRKGWIALKRSLLIGVDPRGYRGFEQTFGSKITIRTVFIDDFFSREFDRVVGELKDKQYQCALVVVPRFLETPEKTRSIYTETKIKILEHGIPVQVILNDDRVTESRNDTLLGKSTRSRPCFGIALNILVKTGAILTALARSFSDKLLRDSIVLGYNIIRVPPRKEEMLKSLHSTKRTIPLAAPLILSDNTGSKILHPPIYRLENETSLFKEEQGKDIISRIPDHVQNVVIHKDGPLFDMELQAIEELFQDGDKKVYPISIIRNEVPRVFNTAYRGAGVGLRAGTFLKITENDFVLVTTPNSNWKPEKQGWPCPILIRFCGASANADAETKRKLVYQIYALTKMQVGSQRSTRLPVSIHYSNMIAKFVRRAGNPTPTYLNFFTENPNARFIPKWYV